MARGIWPGLLTALTVIVGCTRADDPTPQDAKAGEQQASAPLPKPSADSHSRPNVLLISLDTVRADHLGCYGYQPPGMDVSVTPNLDRLASEGVRFASCRSQAPWTLPSHMSLFTSLLPSHNGVDNLNKVLAPKFITLAEVLQQQGYQTAALVNDGQMKAHWGFNRGFKTWREFAVDTPEGNCESITASALDWLRAAGEEPFFLFLHYYDAHDPYEAAEPFRRRFGVELTGAQCRELCFAHRGPIDQGRASEASPPLSKEQLAQLTAAYDAELAWLDHELGRLLAAVPPETLVVVFADHGEAFDEHGWLLHGATLYEEEIRVPLIVRLPQKSRDSRPAANSAVVESSVGLLDVAPTILAECGIGPPRQFQGTDLHALWEQAGGATANPRLVLSETKAVLEGRLALSAVLAPLKGIYSPLEGRFELYKLPDEQTNVAAEEPAPASALRGPLEAWFAQETFWMVHATGSGDYEATIELSTGSFGLYIPLNLDAERDDLQVSPDGRTLRWHVYPGKSPRPKSLFLQPADPQASLMFDAKINGQRVSNQVFLGHHGHHPDKLPVTLVGGGANDRSMSNPNDVSKYDAGQAGFHCLQYVGQQGVARSDRVVPLDVETIRKLKSLGYLK